MTVFDSKYDSRNGGSLEGMSINDQNIFEHSVRELLRDGADPGTIKDVEYLLGKYVKLASKDGLTGLYNRRHFDNLVKREQSLVLRHKRPSSVILFDIDGFKGFNDTYGHVAGDYVLKNLSEIMLNLERDEDFSCRYGGEEFAVILPETNVEGAYVNAERLREGIEEATWNYEGKDLGRVTISAGVSDIVPGRSIEDIVKKVDSALSVAKGGGKNCVVRC